MDFSQMAIAELFECNDKILLEIRTIILCNLLCKSHEVTIP